MTVSIHSRAALAAGLMLVSACGPQKPAGPADSDDRELTGSLASEIQVDPAKVGAPEAVRASAPDLPAGQRSPAAIAAARAEAARLVGGAVPPAPQAANDAASRQAIADAGKRLSGGSADCAAKAKPGTAWSAHVPAALAIYPRAHVVEAAGADRDGCNLRVVSFVTPVGIDDVLGYYNARVRAEGLSAARGMDGKDHVLGGSSAKLAYVIYARGLPNGLTEVDILTTGN